MPDVVTLMRDIEEECQSMKNGLSGLAVVASHRIIQHKYKALTGYTNHLAHHIGEEAATETVGRIYTEVMG